MGSNFRSAGELAAALRAREVSSVELTDAAIAGIERDDRVINAICVPDFDRARAAARHADHARGRGEDRPLLGIPVTVRESYNMVGMPTTWGMPQYRNFVPAEDAVQVSRLKAAGAVVLGKTNVPLGLQDVQSFNEIYGTTNNPWNRGRTSGGSSGGSAAALASGFGALSIGSDLAGSLRTPAHFCGVYAHKPTLGLAAMRGMTPPPAPALPTEADLAVVGPMARTAPTVEPSWTTFRPRFAPIKLREGTSVSTAPQPSPPADPTNASAQISAVSATGGVAELRNRRPRRTTPDASTRCARRSIGCSARTPSFSTPTPCSVTHCLRRSCG